MLKYGSKLNHCVINSTTRYWNRLQRHSYQNKHYKRRSDFEGTSSRREISIENFFWKWNTRFNSSQLIKSQWNGLQNFCNGSYLFFRYNRKDCYFVTRNFSYIMICITENFMHYMNNFWPHMKVLSLWNLFGGKKSFTTRKSDLSTSIWFTRSTAIRKKIWKPFIL